MRSRRWFTRPQWIFLAVVANASLIIVGSMLLSRYRNERGMDIRSTFDSISQPKSRTVSSGYYATPARKIESFVFDPNEADSTQLLRLGLAPFQVRSIYRYRANGGRYSTKDDFRRVYRLTNEQWEHLSPLIQISNRYRLVDIVSTGDERYSRSSGYEKKKGYGKQHTDSVRHNYPKTMVSSVNRTDSLSVLRDSITDSIHHGRQPSALAVRKDYRQYPKKLSGDETLDLNTADSAMLCRVPGIGAYYARKIVEYRRRLGGYSHVEQLLQIENFPVDAIAWLEITDTAQVTRLRVNHMSTRQLMKHPYMGYYRASEIMSHRRIYGKVKDIEVLKTFPHFSEEDIRLLTPYLDFD